METDKEKLTLKEVQGYFIHELLIQVESVDGIEILPLTGLYSKDGEDIIQVSNTDYYVDGGNEFTIKPILRPLSDLTKEITHNGETFVPCKILFPLESLDKLTGYTSEKYAKEFIDSSNRLDICYDYNHWQKLHEWHFDFKELIERGLAININDLPNEQPNTTTSY